MMGRPKGSRNKPKVTAQEIAERFSGEPEPAEAPVTFTLDEPLSLGLGAAQKVGNGAIPRALRTCGQCDHSRLAGREMRCWREAPMPFVSGWLDGVNGGPPRAVVIPLQRPTWPDYSCADWKEREADHPDFGVREYVADVPVEEQRH